MPKDQPDAVMPKDQTIEKEVKTTQEICAACGGSGVSGRELGHLYEEVCPTCGGSGRVGVTVSIEPCP